MEKQPFNKRNTWDEKKFRRVLRKAARSSERSWGVAGIRDRKTGEMQTVLMFRNDDNEYAFAFTDREEVAMLCNGLMTMADRIHKGEFGK